MIKFISIIWHSLVMALQELKHNKLRTFLSLFGITIGIFCIISVLATVDNLQRKIKDDFAAFGSNTIYIDKWQYGGGPDYPWWKYYKRPAATYAEMKFIKERTALAENVCLFSNTNTNIYYGNYEIKQSSIYGVTEEFNKMQDVQIGYGRYFSNDEFARGIPAGIIGYEYATDLFDNAEYALGKEIEFSGKRVLIVGVIQKQGSSMIGGFDYDHCIIVPFLFFASAYNVKNTDPAILVNTKQNASVEDLTEELRGNMRQVRRIEPGREDNFSLNDVNLLSESTSGVFSMMNLAGWAIAGLSLLVGAFGVANIMFVTVRERTSQIGLKKALGAKKRTILSEFLLESAFLCVLGGLLGLLLVWILGIIVGNMLSYPIVIALHIVVLAFSICIVIGILAGIIPAMQAAKMDPVVAIRTK